MARLTDNEKLALVSVVAELRAAKKTWAEVADDPRVTVSAGSALRYFKEYGEPKPGDPILNGAAPPPAEEAEPEGEPVLYEKDGFTPVDAVRAHHEELGWCVVLGDGPGGYSVPHTVVRSEKLNQTFRVPTDQLQFVDVTGAADGDA